MGVSPPTPWNRSAHFPTPTSEPTQGGARVDRVLPLPRLLMYSKPSQACSSRIRQRYYLTRIFVGRMNDAINALNSLDRSAVARPPDIQLPRGLSIYGIAFSPLLSRHARNVALSVATYLDAVVASRTGGSGEIPNLCGGDLSPQGAVQEASTDPQVPRADASTSAFTSGSTFHSDGRNTSRPNVHFVGGQDSRPACRSPSTDVKSVLSAAGPQVPRADASTSASTSTSASAFMPKTTCVDAASLLSELFEEFNCPGLLESYSGTTVVELIADRVSLPKHAGKIPLTKHMPNDEALIFQNPSKMLRPLSEVVPPRAPARVIGEQTQYVKLVQRCLGLGMWTLYDRAKGRPPVVNGIFVVRKDDESDRLIVNAKPANSFFVTPRAVHLPTPDVLADLTVPRDGHHKLYVSKTDLSDFYHSLLLPEWMTDYFCLPPVRAGDLDGFDPSDDTLVYPKCLSLPMGWSHSVIAAQIVHEFIAAKKGLFQRAPPLSRLSEGSVVSGQPRSQLYIDDFVVYGLDEAEVKAIQREHEDAVTEAGFLVKRTKSVPPRCEPPVKCVGVTVDGTQMLAGVAPVELEELVRTTRQVLAARFVSGRSVARIVGAWVWAVSVRRPALAVFSAVYQYIRKFDERPGRLWPSVRVELVNIMALAPLLWVSLRCTYFSHLISTDASTAGFGAAVAKAQPEVSTRLARCSISGAVVNLLASARQPNADAEAEADAGAKANANANADAARGALKALLRAAEQWAPGPAWAVAGLPCLLPTINRSTEPLPRGLRLLELPGGFRPVYEALLQQRWRVSVSGKWHDPGAEHINVRELRAALYGLRSAIAMGCRRNERVLVFVDSLVALGALDKGRTSSFHLLRRVRQIAALVLTTGVRPVYRYIETDWNPSDAASRALAHVGDTCASKVPPTSDQKQKRK